ncbi:MAG: glycosyltransferase family 39 protein [Oculatellaceae cyanobacterium Prado106]|nr:glycosyltransferase family 39 protein [Oculatellaceae cyanobacterium Prado106]
MTKSLDKRTGFRLLLSLMIILGIFFRVVHVDQRVFWDDEVITALRISGYQVNEISKELYHSENFSFQELQQQYLSPNPSRNLQDVIQGIAIEDAHMPPLYFLLARFWAQLFGGSIGSIRGLSILAGILTIPAMYWLCVELFRSRAIASLGTAIFAISPFHILYAQDARSYALWTLVLLCSNALFLRVLRKPSALGWSLYALTVTTGIYTHLFNVFVTIAHGIYVLIRGRFRLNRNFWSFLSAGLFGALTFLPWLLVIVSNKGQSQTAVSTVFRESRFSLPSLISMWVGNISRIIFDIGLSSHDAFAAILPFIPLILLVAALVVYSLYYLCRHAPSQVSLFVMTLIATPTFFYVLSDLVMGGRISGVPRYSLALFIGLQLAITYLFASKLFNPKLFNSRVLDSKLSGLKLSNPQLSNPQPSNPQLSNPQLAESNLFAPNLFASNLEIKQAIAPNSFETERSPRSKPWHPTPDSFETRQSSAFWTLLLIAVLSCSLFSCFARFPAIAWWHQSPSTTRALPVVMAKINQFDQALVITDHSFVRAMSLVYGLKSQALVQLVPPGGNPVLPNQPIGSESTGSESTGNEPTEIFLFRPSEDLQRRLKQMNIGTLRPIPNTDNFLYQLDLSQAYPQRNPSLSNP